MRHKFFALEQSGGLHLVLQPPPALEEGNEKRVHITRTSVQALAGLCMRLELLAAKCGDEWKEEDETRYLQAPDGEWAVEGVEEDDRHGLVKALEGIVARIENAISILYLTKSPFSRVLRSLGAAIETDPNHILRALQLYAEQLEQRKARKAQERERRDGERGERDRDGRSSRPGSGSKRDSRRERDKERDRERDRDRDKSRSRKEGKNREG
ncbi:hypothetical protein BC832DRAFT_410758 [Gaertneriomyces semiglobifer]|nr:hypothetical protein BC832DRAFT_410758 [Gaertneriomyces semiglobifer]